MRLLRFYNSDGHFIALNRDEVESVQTYGDDRVAIVTRSGARHALARPPIEGHTYNQYLIDLLGWIEAEESLTVWNGNHYSSEAQS